MRSSLQPAEKRRLAYTSPRSLPLRAHGARSRKTRTGWRKICARGCRQHTRCEEQGHGSEARVRPRRRSNLATCVVVRRPNEVRARLLRREAL
eukprot:2157247-Prymnesium_polylepis.3